MLHNSVTILRNAQIAVRLQNDKLFAILLTYRDVMKGRCFMVKKIRLLGMVMDHFTLREEMLQSEEFYHKQELNIIRTVSINMLNMAADSKAVRAGIAQADLLVVADREILTEAGISSGQRLREVGGHEFMQEYLKHLSCSRRRVFLAAQDKEELDYLTEFLQTAYEKLQIVGSYVLDECGSEYDMMINEINAAAADIVVSALKSPSEDAFLQYAKTKLSARIWYSLGDNYRDADAKVSVAFRFQKLIHWGRFKNVIHHYEKGIYCK